MNEQAMISLMTRLNRTLACNFDGHAVIRLAKSVTGALNAQGDIAKKRASVELSKRTVESELEQLEAELQSLRDKCLHMDVVATGVEYQDGDAKYDCQTCGARVLL